MWSRRRGSASRRRLSRGTSCPRYRSIVACLWRLPTPWRTKCAGLLTAEVGQPRRPERACEVLREAFDEQRRLRLGVLISGGGSTLANLIARIDDGRLRNVEIAVVISSRGTVRGVGIARSAGLRLEIVRKRDFLSGEAFSDAISAVLDAANVDLVVLGGFLCYWHVPARYADRTLNIHPALLPAYGGQGFHGRHVHEAVLAGGEKVSGCTVHLVDDQYDHGPIIAQTRVPVRSDDTAEALAGRVGEAERELYPAVIQRIADSGLQWLDGVRRPQQSG